MIKLDLEGYIRYFEDSFFMGQIKALIEMELLLVSMENDIDRLNVGVLMASKMEEFIRTLNMRLQSNYGVKLAGYDELLGDILQFESPNMKQMMGLRNQFSFCEVDDIDRGYGIRYDIVLDESSIDREIPEWAQRSDEHKVYPYVTVEENVEPPTEIRGLTDSEVHKIAQAFVEDLWEANKLRNLDADALDDALGEINELKQEIKNRWITTAVDYPHGTYVLVVFQALGNKYQDDSYRFDKSLNEYFIDKNGDCEYVSKKDWI